VAIFKRQNRRAPQIRPYDRGGNRSDAFPDHGARLRPKGGHRDSRGQGDTPIQPQSTASVSGPGPQTRLSRNSCPGGIRENADGSVGDLRIIESSRHRLLDRSAMKAVKHWQFQPGRQGDDTIAMWVRVPVQFRLK
jgi:TonB family protein